MSFVKKLPAVLIAAVGISFGFVGTALAETTVLADKTLGAQEEFRFKPQDMRDTTICFQTTDNLPGYLKVTYLAGRDVKTESIDASPKEKCITRSMSMIFPVIVLNFPKNNPGLSRAVRVYAKQG
jgi:hypothetical protein